jgi:glycosyltransferase involved in cell wall biosynthesis
MNIKVCMIVWQFPPVYGGAGIQALALAKILKKKGVECVVLTPQYAGLSKNDVMEGIDIIRFKLYGKGRLPFLMFNLQAIINIIKNRKSYRVVHFHSIWPFCFLVRAVARFLKMPFIVKLSSLGFDNPINIKNKSFLWKREYYTLRSADKIIALSDALKKACLRAGFSKDTISLIPNGVDMDRYNPITNKNEKNMIRRELNLPETHTIITFVGRICKHKGSDLLFDSWKRIGSLFPAASLLMIGPYSLRKSDNKLILDELVSVDREYYENVVLTGVVSNVSDYLRVSDIFVFPSRTEGLPNALIEAMACGLPAIATRIPGVTDNIIESKRDGILINNFSEDELAKKTIALLEDPEYGKYLSRNARQKIKNEFSIGKVAEKYKCIYEELLAGHSCMNSKKKWFM